MTSSASERPATGASSATGASKPLRPRKCRACRARFVPLLPKQVVCSQACAIDNALAERAKRERKEDRKRLDELKPVATVLREAAAMFNAYIRERDKELPCVSCGRHHDGQWQAGHYMSSHARPALRFDEANVHKQCVPCNKHLSGNLVSYRETLLHRIGQAEVLRLEAPAAPKKWTREELLAIKATYSAKRRELSHKENRR